MDESFSPSVRTLYYGPETGHLSNLSPPFSPGRLRAVQIVWVPSGDEDEGAERDVPRWEVVEDDELKTQWKPEVNDAD